MAKCGTWKICRSLLSATAPAKDYGSEVPENYLQRLMQTVEGYEPNEYLPAVTMQFCQNTFDSYALNLQLNVHDGSLDCTAIIGEPPVALHRVAYIFLRDSLNHYLATGGNELPMSEIPRGAYKFEAGSIYGGSDGPNISIGMTTIWMVLINTCHSARVFPLPCLPSNVSPTLQNLTHSATSFSFPIASLTLTRLSHLSCIPFLPSDTFYYSTVVPLLYLISL